MSRRRGRRRRDAEGHLREGPGLTENLPVRLAFALVSEDDGLTLPDWLSSSERVRGAAIAARRRRAQFVAGRRLARRALAACVAGSVPRDWALGAGDATPPFVERAPVQAPSPLFVSITHSEHWVACAAAAAPVGLDLESNRPRRNLDALAQAVLSPSEWLAFQACLPAERSRFFYAVWTLKEAAVKRGGDGLDLASLPRWNVRPCPAGAGEGRLWRDEDATLALVAPADAQLHWVVDGHRWGAAERWRVDAPRGRRR